MKLCSGKNWNIVQDSSWLPLCGLTPHTPFWLLLPSLHIPSQVSCLHFCVCVWKILRKAIFLNNNLTSPLVHQDAHQVLWVFVAVVVVDICLFSFSLWFGSPRRSVPSCRDRLFAAGRDESGNRGPEGAGLWFSPFLVLLVLHPFVCLPSAFRS